MKGKTWRGLFCNKTKSGELIWLDTIIEPIYDQNRKLQSFTSIRLNVTDKIQNLIALEEKENKLAEISKTAAIGELSSFIAHEINNPLTIMQLSLDSIQTSINSASPNIEYIKTNFEKINLITERISRIVKSLSNMTRLDSQTQFQATSINDIIDEVLLMSGDKLNYSNAIFKIDFKSSKNLILNCNKTQITQVIINLINNSCDAIKECESKEILLCIDSFIDRLEISIIDSGKKIPIEVVNKLFTPYFTTKKAGIGTGVGLTVSKKIIEAHNGQLILDTSVEKTCFKIILPLI